ncbi:Dps family protein [Zavarzinia sp. CC-PAN008]|uniref:Dps family protein n=1 Tax=Zavarzinia sp. CC-PAN008 TaxID=3243332 RepID=UPI003F746895
MANPALKVSADAAPAARAPIDIGIDEQARRQIGDGLSRLLADSFVLYLKTHNYHWNVTGPQFNALHAMFMEQYTELWNALDEIAERIRALGFFAPGSNAKFAQLTTLRDDDGVPSAEQMVQNLVEGHEAVVRTAREAMKAAEAAEDAPTADLLTIRMKASEKFAWMLRSMIAPRA